MLSFSEEKANEKAKVKFGFSPYQDQAVTVTPSEYEKAGGVVHWGSVDNVACRAMHGLVVGKLKSLRRLTCVNCRRFVNRLYKGKGIAA